MDSAVELNLRRLIMASIAEHVAETGLVTRDQLTNINVGGETRRAIDRSRGIWNPRDLSATLSVVSSPNSEYSDTDIGNSLFRYDYRKGSPEGDNKKLRRAFELEFPIILLRRIKDGVYAPVFPVYVIADDVDAKQFVFALDESLRFLKNPLTPTADERTYAERITKQRLHQTEFRGRVLSAYRTECSICNLKHGRLLDAAHITPDADCQGLPIASNGLSLCKIHHTAYDTDFIGISSDYVVHVNGALLQESDGPMLRHGLQEMHGRRISVPSMKVERPDRDRLELRFQHFLGTE